MAEKSEPTVSTNPPDEAPIEVGHYAGDPDSGFRLWCAREALRQGEMRVVGEMASVAAMMGRAASSLGWTITLALAVAAAAGATHVSLLIVGSLACLLLAAVCFAAVLWPRWWWVPGDDPNWILGRPRDSELEMVEALAKRTSMASERNKRGIAKLSRRLRMGAALLVAAVACALMWSVLARDYLPGLAVFLAD